jgi:hypothetical protein
MNPRSASEYVDHIQSRARYTFTRSELEVELKLGRAALTKALQRLHRAGRIQMIRRGFFVIVPLEYAAGGLVPPDWFIDDLMRFLEQPYYVGVLTAATLHGAGHQQPQDGADGVMTGFGTKARRPELTVHLPTWHFAFNDSGTEGNRRRPILRDI